MRFDINYDNEKMRKSRLRMEKRSTRKYADRVPVNFCIVPRYFTPIFGIEYNEIFKDARTQYEFLLKFAKYQIENIDDDCCTDPVIRIHPYFDNVVEPSGFGCDVVWPRNETLKAVPFMNKPHDMEEYALENPALFERN